MADNNAGEAAAYSPFLDLLPLEVRNMIYRLAYVEESGRLFPIISKVNWTAAERMRRRGDRRDASRRGTSERFPTPPLRGMHVSRQFEAEAVQEWFRHHIIDCDDLPQWAELCKLDARIQANVVSLRCSWGNREPAYRILGGPARFSDFSQVRKCKQLRILQLTVNDRIFDAVPDRMICHDNLEPKDFQVLEAMADFTSMATLQSVVLIPEQRGMLASAPEEQQKWKDNLQGLEDFINHRIRDKRLDSRHPAWWTPMTFQDFMASAGLPPKTLRGGTKHRLGDQRRI